MRFHREDDGATLVVVLVFAVVFTLVVTGLLMLTGTGVRAARSYTDAAQQHAAADGATQIAIRQVEAGEPCAGDLTAPAIAGTSSIVRCTGSASTPPSSAGAALTSVGSATGEDGIVSAAAGLRVRGDVFANAAVTAGTGDTVDVTGDVRAVGTCATAVVATGTVACSDRNGAAAATPVPDVDAPTATLPPLRTVPACPVAPAWLVTLTPGYYDSPGVVALNALTGGACRGVVVWLQPGVYYFDFGFGSTAVSAWTVSDPSVAVVGGTAHGWDPSASARPDVPLPGGCSTTAAGVQIALGGTSRLRVDHGHVEICGPPDGHTPAVYGVTGSSPQHLLAPGSVAQSNGFSNPARALAIGETPTPLTADAPLGTDRRTAALQVGAFRPDVPDGSVLAGVQLVVAHDEPGGAVDAGVIASFPGRTTGAGCALGAGGRVTLPRRAVLTSDTVDLAACGLTTAAAVTALQVAVTATTTGTGTEHLDGVAVRVGYRIPVSFLPTATATPAPGTSDVPYTDAADAERVDGTAASAALSVGDRSSLTLSGYDQPPVPEGSTVRSAVLRVAHAETGAAGGPVVAVRAGDGSPACASTTLPNRSTSTVDTVDLLACGVDTPARLAGLVVTVSDDAAGGAGRSTLDGVELRVLAAPPTSTRTAGVTASPAVAGTAAFTTPDDAEQVAEAPRPRTADVTLPAGGVDTATLSLRGFDTAQVPDDAPLTTAVLDVAHTEDASGTTAAVSVSGPGYTGPCAATPVPLPTRTGGGTDHVDLVASCGLTDPTVLAGLTVTYRVAVAGGAAATADHLDGITLTVDHAPTVTASAGTVAPVAGAAAFTPATAAGAVDGATADVTLPSGGQATAAVSLGGYDLAAVPGSATLLAADLRVAHAESGPGLTPTVAVPGTSCTGAAARRLPARTDGLVVDTVDLVASCGVTSAAQLAGLTVTYAATVTAGTAVDRLDGTSLEVAYRPPVTALPATATSPATGAGGGSFAPLTAVPAIDGTVATADLDGGSPSASVDLTGFTPPPAGSKLSAAVLRVAHREDDGVAAPQLRVSVPSATVGGAPCTTTVTAPSSATLTTDRFPLGGACPLTNAAQVEGLRVTYVAQLAAGGSAGRADLDGLVLDVTVDAPRLRAESGCTVATPYPTGAGSCAALQATDTAGGDSRLVVDGQVHLPASPVDLAMTGLTFPVVTGGIVARTIHLGLAPAAGFDGALLGPAAATASFTFTTFVAHTTVPTKAAGAFTSPDAARVVDGRTATSRLSASSPSAAIDLTGWSGTAARRTVLRLAHQEDGPVTELSALVALPADATGPAVSCRLPVPVHTDAGAPVTDQFDLTAVCGIAAGRDLSGLDVTYRAAGTSPATVGLDGLQLDLLDDPVVTATVGITAGTAHITSWETNR